MFQVYFITVVSLILSGLVLALTERFVDRFPLFRHYLGIFEKPYFRLVLGLLAVLASLFNLFYSNALTITIGEASVRQGGDFFIGNLIPGLLGLWSGAVLVANFFAQQSNTEIRLVKWLNACMLLRIPLGICTLVAGVLHFLMPQTLLF